VTVDLVLIARAAVDPVEAQHISLQLTLERVPADRADRFAIRFWRSLLPLIAYVGQHSEASLLEEARLVGGDTLAAVEAALTVPRWLLERAGATAELIRIFNDGHATDWKLPLTGANAPASPDWFGGSGSVGVETSAPFAAARQTHYARRFA
jgi:hypothetical protein